MAKKTAVEKHLCGDCANVTPVMEPHHLLDIHGNPTLGTCPYWTESRCVLLSWRSECKNFKIKTNGTYKKTDSGTMGAADGR